MKKWIMLFFVVAAAQLLRSEEEPFVFDLEEPYPFDLNAYVGKYASDEERLRLAYSSCVSKLKYPSQDIVVPVENYPNGAIKAEVTAQKAQFFEKDALVWCGGVIVREYSIDGKVITEVFAESCVVDRKTKSGWFEGHTIAVHQKTNFKGKGIYFSFSDEYVKISSNVEITTSDIKFQGVKL